MKTRFVAGLSFAFLAGGIALAADMPGTKKTPLAAAGAEKPQTNRAVGVVRSLDAAKGTITLSHEPVPSIKWPAMTMGFKISKELAASVKSGDKVSFEFTAKDMDGTVTKIAVIK